MWRVSRPGSFFYSEEEVLVKSVHFPRSVRERPRFYGRRPRSDGHASNTTVMTVSGLVMYGHVPAWVHLRVSGRRTYREVYHSFLVSVDY